MSNRTLLKAVMASLPAEARDSVVRSALAEVRRESPEPIASVLDSFFPDGLTAEQANDTLAGLGLTLVALGQVFMSAEDEEKLGARVKAIAEGLPLTGAPESAVDVATPLATITTALAVGSDMDADDRAVVEETLRRKIQEAYDCYDHHSYLGGSFLVKGVHDGVRTTLHMDPSQLNKKFRSNVIRAKSPSSKSAFGAMYRKGVFSGCPMQGGFWDNLTSPGALGALGNLVGNLVNPGASVEQQAASVIPSSPSTALQLKPIQIEGDDLLISAPIESQRAAMTSTIRKMIDEATAAKAAASEKSLTLARLTWAAVILDSGDEVARVLAGVEPKMDTTKELFQSTGDLAGYAREIGDLSAIGAISRSISSLSKKEAANGSVASLLNL